MMSLSRLEFLSVLEKRISALPEKDIRKTVDYYNEMLEDYSEDGLDTDAALEKMGGIDRIVSDILSETKEQNSEDGGGKLDTGTAIYLARVLKAAHIFALSLGISVCLASSSILALATVVTLIEAAVSLFSSSVIAGIFSLGASLVFGAISLISGIGGIYLIKYLKKLISKNEKQTKGENKNEVD